MDVAHHLCLLQQGALQGSLEEGIVQLDHLEGRHEHSNSTEKGSTTMVAHAWNGANLGVLAHLWNGRAWSAGLHSLLHDSGNDLW
jgi:hypothetical protein